MRISRWAAAAAAALLAGGLGIAGAPPASATSYSINVCDLEIGGHSVRDGDHVIVVVPDGSPCGLNVFNPTEPVMIGYPVGSGVLCYSYTFNTSTLAVGTGAAIGVHITTSSFATLGDATQTECGGPAAGGGEIQWTQSTGSTMAKDHCKHGEWEDLGFRNQGQCVAYFEASEHSHRG